MLKRKTLRHAVNHRVPRLEDHDQTLLELGLVDVVGGAFEAADDDVADVVAFDDSFGFVPLTGFVEGLDVGFTSAVRRKVAAPLEFVPGPAEDGGLA